MLRILYTWRHEDAHIVKTKAAESNKTQYASSIIQQNSVRIQLNPTKLSTHPAESNKTQYESSWIQSAAFKETQYQHTVLFYDTILYYNTILYYDTILYYNIKFGSFLAVVSDNVIWKAAPSVSRLVVTILYIGYVQRHSAIKA